MIEFWGLLIQPQRAVCLLLLLGAFGGSPRAFASDSQQSVITPELLKQVDQLLTSSSYLESASVVLIPIEQLANEPASQHRLYAGKLNQTQTSEHLSVNVIALPDAFILGVVLLSLMIAAHFWQRRGLSA